MYGEYSTNMRPINGHTPYESKRAFKLPIKILTKVQKNDKELTKRPKRNNKKIRDLICFNALTNWKGWAEAYHPKKREKRNNNLKIRRRRKK